MARNRKKKPYVPLPHSEEPTPERMARGSYVSGPIEKNGPKVWRDRDADWLRQCVDKGKLTARQGKAGEIATRHLNAYYERPSVGSSMDFSIRVDSPADPETEADRALEAKDRVSAIRRAAGWSGLSILRGILVYDEPTGERRMDLLRWRLFTEALDALADLWRISLETVDTD